MRTNIALLAALLLFPALTWASSTKQQGQVTLQQLTRPAGYIFVGRVKSIQYLPANNFTRVATVRIRFQVEEGLRGVRSGREFTIRQWAGLWDAGQRYRIGERLLLFLYPPSKLGLTSPVGGPPGHITLDRNGRALLRMERTVLRHEMIERLRRDRASLRRFPRPRGIEEE